jgi:hypothetical protein
MKTSRGMVGGRRLEENQEEHGWRKARRGIVGGRWLEEDQEGHGGRKAVGGKLEGTWSEENQEERGLRKTRRNIAVTDGGNPRGTWPRWTENQEGHDRDGRR